MLRPAEPLCEGTWTLAIGLLWNEDPRAKGALRRLSPEAWEELAGYVEKEGLGGGRTSPAGGAVGPGPARVRNATVGAMQAKERSHSTRQLVLATIAFTSAFYVWALYGPLSPDLQHDLKLTEVQLAWLVAIPVVLGSVMRVPMGVLTDRYGARRTFPALLGFTALPLLALAAWHSSFWSLAGLGFLLGFAGSSFAIGVPFVSRWYGKERQGFALGIYGMGMGGTVLTALTAPTLAQRFGLATVFIVAAVLVVTMAVVFSVVAEEPPTPRPKVTSLVAPFRIFGVSGRAWALTLFYFVAFGGFVAMFLYLPKLLVGVHDLSKADAGARAAGFALLAVLARPLGGYLSDRIGARKVLLISFTATSLLAVGLAFGYANIVAITLCCLTLAVAFGLGTGAVFKLVAAWFPEQVGAVTGVVGAAGGLGGFFPPLVMALVKSLTGSYTLGFVLFAVVAAACLIVLQGFDRPRTKRQRRANVTHSGPTATRS
jgi:MFS transporter, NNP family, nitrate/nitrite transporter